ncbi:uncharacterized protein LOC143298355 isoform X2 [Babylonia areolata]|uniref:uncharacterized protein LOC143298355 isoform X2 n=1 Tax=Babylonia areolata TaxID=304850 RepID=UPI003FD689CF
MCLFCESGVEEEVVHCYDCKQWAHWKCAGLSDLEVQILSGTSRSIQWVCQSCLAGQTEKRQLGGAQLEELTQLINGLCDQINALEKGNTDACSEEEQEEKKLAEALEDIQEEAADVSLTEGDVTEKAETESSEKSKDKEIEVREHVESGGPEVEQEAAEDQVHVGDVKDFKPATLTGDVQPPQRQWSDFEQCEHRFHHDSHCEPLQVTAGQQTADAEPSAPSVLRYSRDQLLQVGPSPVTPQLIFRLHSLNIAFDSPEKQRQHNKTLTWWKLKCDVKPPVQQTDAEQCERSDQHDGQTEPLHLTPEQQTDAEQCERSDRHNGQTEPLRVTPEQQTDAEQCERSDQHDGQTEPLYITPEQQTDAEQTEQTVLRYSRDQLLQITPAPLAPELILRLRWLNIAADCPQKPYQRKTGSWQQLKCDVKPPVQQTDAEQCERSDQHDGQTEPLHLTPEQQTDAEQCERSDRHNGQTEPLRVTPEQQTDAEQCERSDQHDGQTEPLYITPEQQTDAEQTEQTVLRYSRDQLLQITPAPLAPELILRLRWLNIAADCPQKPYQRKTGSWQQLKCDVKPPVQQTDAEQCERSDQHDGQTEPLHLTPEQQTDAEQCERSDRHDGQTEPLRVTPEQQTDAEQCERSDQHDSQTDTLYVTPEQPTSDAEQPEQTVLRYSRDQLLQITPAPLAPELILRLRWLNIAADCPQKPYQRKTGSWQQLKIVTNSRQQPDHTVTNSRQQPDRTVTNGRQQPDRTVTNSRQQPDRTVTDSRQQPDRTVTNGRQQPDRTVTNGRQQPDRTVTNGRQQPDSMPSPGREEGVGIEGGTFTCFLCEAGGFSAEGMERHLWACHQEGQEGMPKSSCQTSDVPMVDGESEAEGGQSPQVFPGMSAVDDDLDAGSDDALQTSLRLNDCPREDDMTEQYDLNTEDEVAEQYDLNTEDEVAEQYDLNTEGEVNSDGDRDENEADVEWGGGQDTDSNLSVILGFTPTTDLPLQSGSGSQVGHTHHGGARPKVRPSPTHPPPTTPEGQQTAADWQASGGGVEDRVLTCPFCSFRTMSQGQIQDHVHHQHLMEEGGAEDTDFLFQYICPFCATGFDTPRDLSHHVDTHHPDMDSTRGPSAQHWSEGEGSVAQSASDPSPAQEEAASSLQCPVCGAAQPSEASLSIHIDQHFASSSHSPLLPTHTNPDDDHQMALQLQKEEDRQQMEENKNFETVQAQQGMDNSMTARQQFDRDLERAAIKGQITTSQFHAKKVAHAQSSRSGVDDSSTLTAGVVEKLQQFYDSRGCPRTVTRVHLCAATHHFSASYGDRGWGCGYRNLQMLLSSLMNDPTYLQVLFNGRAKIPSIQKLQQLMEAAWQKGFDPQGCQQLGGALVNTRKWIGATEIVAMLSSLRIKCELLDFVHPSGPNNTHPVLLQWVRGYFTSPTSPFTPPLYLQHQGHSRTIVGVEELTNGNTNLLLFDPGVPPSRMEQFQGSINSKLLQTVRKTTNAFRARQYQIVAVVGVLSEGEFERSKRIQSKRMS